MTKKEMIVIAVLVNVGVLAVIFLTALSLNEDYIEKRPVTLAVPLAESHFSSSAPRTEPLFQGKSFEEEKAVGNDEVDRMLNLYAVQEMGRSAPGEATTVAAPESCLPATSSPMTSMPQSSSKNSSDEDAAQQFVDITVKKGDFLDKIARANGTTADRLMQINHLNTDRIDVGQILKVPISNTKKRNESKVAVAKKEKKGDSTKSTGSSDSQYYTVKAGDKLWTIAPQFNVKVDDLLKMNHLDEERARNLKVGDKIRVK